MKSLATRLLERFGKKNESSINKSVINYFADNLFNDDHPIPYNIKAIRNGQIIDTVLYDVSVDSISKRINDATHGIAIDDPVATSWWKHIDALQVFAGDDTTPCLTWHRNESPSCLAALHKLQSATGTLPKTGSVIQYVTRGALKK